tara:strand:+ start:680 stop:1504 length:825 start_codon:yes stop_codon:yes gene_type:complete
MLLEISIGINPIIFQYKSLIISWHGFFTMVGVLVSVLLVARWAKKENISSDIVYSVAIWGVLGGIIGARLVHVIDRWDYYSQNFGQIFTLWEGGIAIYGGILGGFLAGGLYAVLCKYPVRKLMDLTAPAVLISMAIGRLGDIINGEHFSKPTEMIWGFVYTHSSVQSLYNKFNPEGYSSFVPSHPAVAYELIYDLFIAAIAWKLKDIIRPQGMTFILFIALYSFGRFFISFVRYDKEWLLGLNQAQLIAIILLVITVPLLVFKVKFITKTKEIS